MLVKMQRKRNLVHSWWDYKLVQPLLENSTEVP